MTTSATSAATLHQVVSHRSLRVLLEWATNFANQATAAGKRVLWAPAHALGGCVSLRTWILDQAAQVLGEATPDQGPLLLSGAADVILIADPASADAGSLHWLTDMLACSQEVADLAAMPPLPQLVVLATTRGATEASDAFVTKLETLGSERVNATGRGSEAAPGAGDIKAVLGRNDDLLAGLALAPLPLTLADVNALAAATGKSGLPVSDLLDSPLFVVAGGYFMPASAEVAQLLRAALPQESLQTGAAKLLPIVESRHESLADARVELALRSGDAKRAGKLARRRFDEHLAAGRNEEALSLVETARKLGLSIESGKFAAEIDDAKLAYLCALVGRHKEAKELFTRLYRLREAYVSADFVRWAALAGRHLVLHAGLEPKPADSLLRRAIRLAADDVSMDVRLTLLRSELLASDIMKLDERAGWLLLHINGEILEDIEPDALAQFLESTAVRMWRHNDVRGAMRRLRKLLVMNLPSAQMARAMLLMARCRNFVADHDATLRFANGSLHHALRVPDLALVTEAAKFIREVQAKRPAELPPLPAPKGPKQRPRIPAMADIAAPSLTDPRQLYDILQLRFGVSHWLRRRGATQTSFGKAAVVQAPIAVLEESEGGWRRVAAGAEGETRALALLRSDGSDLIVFASGGEADQREDALVRLLLADREPAQVSPEGLSRQVVIADYHRRALAHGGDRGLHATMEMLFNKDVLLYFEEQGIGKEEMAERIGVSRATLYRMYARSSLNV